MSKRISRREFLVWGAVGMLGAMFSPCPSVVIKNVVAPVDHVGLDKAKGPEEPLVVALKRSAKQIQESARAREGQEVQWLVPICPIHVEELVGEAAGEMMNHWVSIPPPMLHRTSWEWGLEAARESLGRTKFYSSRKAPQCKCLRASRNYQTPFSL